MGAFYTPGLDYDLNTYLDNLGAYTTSEGRIEELELARQLTESGQYYFLGVPFPGRANTLIAGRDTFTGDITVPPLSFIVCLTGDMFYNVAGPQAQPIGTRAAEGFQFRIYDKGAKMDVNFPTSFAQSQPSVGLMGNYNNAASSSSRPSGPFFPPSPLVIKSPGALQLTITNLATVQCYVQILMQLAVPVNRQSANEMIIKGSRRG